jgi:hypothetical protein
VNPVPGSPPGPPYMPIELFRNLEDSILIPYVVMASLLFFVILFWIALWYDVSNNRRPKLIIMCDIRKIVTESFYLLTVETGNDWFGGTSAKVLCQIFGENGKTKVGQFYRCLILHIPHFSKIFHHHFATQGSRAE